MLITILIGLAVLVVLFLVVAALRPADFRIERSISVTAPAALAFGQINDLRKWQEMSPYVKLDPAASYTFSGPAAGVGAAMAWAGNSKAGVGQITITDSRPHELIRFKLEFKKPFTCTNTAEFIFRPHSAGTDVTWALFGRHNLMGRAMGIVVNMDKMIGRDFDAGLANLKAIVEAAVS